MGSIYLNPKVGRIMAQDIAQKAIILHNLGVQVGFRAFCLGLQSHFPDSEASEPVFRTLNPVEALSRTTGWGRVAVGRWNYPKPKTLNQESRELGLAEGLGFRVQVHHN